MKIKRSDFIFLAALVVITGALAALPRIISLDAVKQSIIYETNQALSGKADFTGIEWSWFPVPHLTLKNVNIETKDFNAKIPAISLSPSIKSLLTFSLKLSSMAVIQPEIHIKRLPQKKDSPQNLPSNILIDFIKVSGGKVISQDRLAFHDHQFAPFELTDLDLRLSLSANSADLTRLRFKSSFCKDANITGSFNLSKDLFAGKLSFTELDIAKIAPDILAKNNYSVSSNLNISLEIGKKADFLTAQIWSGTSELTIGYNGNKYPFKLDLAQAELKQGKDGFHLNLQKTALTQPRLAMSGEIQMIDATTEPYWHINLSATDVDTGQVRGHVRGLLDFSQEANLTTDIVLGGSLNTASFEFHGKTNDFKLLRKMIIKADVKDAPIQVLEPRLFIDRASGPIIIENGILWADALHGVIGSSKGANCMLFVPIDCVEDTFLLDVDIEADLGELPRILNDVVPLQWFKDELKLISQTSGKANAHLHVGDHLHDLGVWVNVSNGHLRGKYARIPWDVDVKKLKLAVTPQDVTWEGLEASVGPHAIKKSAGKVEWNDKAAHVEPILSIYDTDFSGDVDAFLNHLLTYEQIKGQLSKVVPKAAGRVDAEKITMTGPFYKPEQWQYDLTARFKDIRFETPLLFGIAKVNSANAHINQDVISFSKVESTVSEEPFWLNATLVHRHLEPFAGKIQLNGVAGEDALSWIKKKEWIPELFFPQKNCGVKNMVLSWDKDNFAIKGTLYPGARYDEKELTVAYDVAVDLDLQLTPQKLAINGINVTSGQEQSHVSCIFNTTNAKNGFELNFNGKLSGATLDLALEHNDILTGSIAGDFSFTYNPATQQQFKGKGALEASSLKWLWGTPIPIQLAHIKLKSEKESKPDKFNTQTIAIEEISFNLGSSFLYGNGTFYSSDKENGYRLDLSTSHLTSKDIDTFTESQEEDSLFAKLTKHISFNVGEYLHFSEPKPCLKPECSQKSKDEKPLHFREVQGTFSTEKGQKHLSLTSADLCGLNIKGNWTAKAKEQMQGVTQIDSSDMETHLPLRLENMLACMDFTQETIEGLGTIHATLEGSPHYWQKGNLSVTSEKGRINKLTFLSKVFSVVNLTDIFTGLLPNLAETGFAYSKLELSGEIKDNVMIIPKTVIKGDGLNLILKGSVNLDNMEGDLLVLIAPLKTVDAIVTKIPLLGRALGGKSGAVLVIPVAVKGKLSDPDVNVLPASAIGSGLANFVKDTLTLPFEVILTPFK